MDFAAPRLIPLWAILFTTLAMRWQLPLVAGLRQDPSMLEVRVANSSADNNLGLRGHAVLLLCFADQAVQQLGLYYRDFLKMWDWKLKGFSSSSDLGYLEKVMVTAADYTDIGDINPLVWGIYHDIEKLCPDHTHFRDELQKGCQGDDTSRNESSLVCGSGCHEPENEMCPEGTRCGCPSETDKESGVGVGRVNFASTWAALTGHFGGHGGYLITEGMGDSSHAMFSVATHAEGCRCIPLQCLQHGRGEDSKCRINGTAWGEKPRISQYPFPGFKCEKFGGSCALLPCALSDYNYQNRNEPDGKLIDLKGKMGPKDSGVYNCWQVSKGEEAGIVYFLPLERRKKLYKAVWG